MSDKVTPISSRDYRLMTPEDVLRDVHEKIEDKSPNVVLVVWMERDESGQETYAFGWSRSLFSERIACAEVLLQKLHDEPEGD